MKNSKQLNSETKKKLKSLGRRSRKFIPLICTKCGNKRDIRINEDNEYLYTEEYKKKYICLLCR